MILLLLSHARPKIIKNFEIGFFESGASWLRGGQALERKPSNAWARKMPALTRPKNAVTVSIIAKIPCAPGQDRTTCDRAQSKGFRARIENRTRLMLCYNRFAAKRARERTGRGLRGTPPFPQRLELPGRPRNP